ncbi:MAG: AAA family ATPase [Bryobacterales bacterium]|nr:AAA family ATPase [Bryobacterales bacterium]
MPLLRMEAEGVGPFAHLEIDFSDGKGKPHLGPHILAGVNGSGKSTVLRAIAWTLAGESGLFGFPAEEWRHSVHGYSSSRASSAIVVGTRSAPGRKSRGTRRSQCAFTEVPGPGRKRKRK